MAKPADHTKNGAKSRKPKGSRFSDEPEPEARPDEVLFDAEAEKGLLSCVSIRRELMAEARIRAPVESFGDPACTALYGAMQRVFDAGGDLSDRHSLLVELAASGDLFDEIEEWQVAEILAWHATSSNFEIYCRRIESLAARRRVNMALDEARAALRGDGDPLATAAKLAGDLQSLAAAGATEEKFSVVDADTFFTSRYDLEFLIENILPVGQPLLICGPSKVLKTSIAVDMAISVATGGSFLGEFQVSAPANVLMVSAESGFPTLQRTAKRVCEAKGIEPPGDLGGRLFFSEVKPNLSDAATLALIRGRMEKLAIKFAVFDPFYLMLEPDDAGDVFRMGKLLRQFGDMCSAAGVTPVALHHSKKGIEVGEPMELSSIAWSGFGEWARAWLLVNRRERYGGDDLHRLWLSAGSSCGAGGIWALDIDEGKFPNRYWSVAMSTREEAENERKAGRSSAADEAEVAKHQADRKAVVAFLKKHPDGETFSQIRTFSGARQTKLGPCLESLVDDKFVVRTKVKKGRNLTYDCFQLVEGDPCEI